jgi:hypothetical protein
MDHENLFPEDGEQLENHLTEDDITYLNRTDVDF